MLYKMTKVPINLFRANIAKWLENLPITLTLYGKSVAVVSIPLAEVEIRRGSTEMCAKHKGSMKITCGC
jgi:hypothetical protein